MSRSQRTPGCDLEAGRGAARRRDEKRSTFGDRAFEGGDLRGGSGSRRAAANSLAPTAKLVELDAVELARVAAQSGIAVACARHR